MYATPSVLRRYASAGFTFPAAFFTAAAFCFSCPALAPPRNPSAVQKSNAPQVPVTTPRRTFTCIRAFVLSARNAQSPKTHPFPTRTLKFSRQPHARSTYFILAQSCFPPTHRFVLDPHLMHEYSRISL